MEALFRYFSGAMSAAASFFVPIGGTVICALVFVGVDFATGVAADRHRTQQSGGRWRFESRRAWRSVKKAGFLITAIAMAWMIDACILDFLTLHTARLMAGFACGVEMWSVLENASEISESALFLQLRRFIRKE